MSTSAIEIKNASFSYGSHNIFKKINFSIGSGQLFCLLGPNGCGKTTLLDCLLGLHRLRSGHITIMGRDIKDFRPGKIARFIAYVPQQHESTFPYSVREIVTMGRAAHLGFFSSPSKNDRRMADRALEEIGIGHLKNRPCTQLSGGETQLVMIARALVQETPVMLLDEPTAHLDFHYELAIMEVITRLVKQRGLSIVMATHFPNHAFHFHNSGIPTSVALFYDRTFQSVGNPEDVLNEQNIKDLYGVTAKVIAIDGSAGSEMKHIVPLATIEE